MEVKSSSFYFNPSELNKFIESSNATCGIAVSSDFENDKIAAVKGGYPKIRLITSKALCKLAKLKEEYQIPTDHVARLLIPQEAILLDGLIDLVTGIFEAKGETGRMPSEEDKLDIDNVPEELRDLGDVTKAMYIILKQNPDKEFEAEELSRKIKETFPKTFANRSLPSISYGTIWAGDTLEDRGLIKIERYKPDPVNYPNWIKRKYKAI